MPRGPHQRGKIIAVTRPGIDPGIEEPLHDVVETARGRIDHRRLAGCVARVRIGAARQQRFDDAVVALERGGDERREAGAAGEVRVGPFGEQQGDGRMLLAVGGGEQCGAAVDIARVDRRAAGEEELDELDPALARGMGERHGAAAVAGEQRGAGVEELARQRLAAPVGRREQRHVGLHGDGVGLDQLIIAFDVAAILLGVRRSDCGEDREQAGGEGAQEGGHHRRSVACRSPPC